jgi:hypothetical protein
MLLHSFRNYINIISWWLVMMPLGNKNVYRNRGICDWISLNQIHQLQESPPWRNINGLHHSCNVQKSQPILLKRIINQTVFSPVHDNTPYSPTSYTGFTTPADGSGESFSDFVGKTPPARLLVSLFLSFINGNLPHKSQPAVRDDTLHHRISVRLPSTHSSISGCYTCIHV